MKTILFSLATFLFSIAVFSQTLVPGGPISGTWTLVGSPYLIDGETIILNDSTLTIVPGVTVEWLGSYTLFVQGQILAQGTEKSNIVIIQAEYII